LEEDFADGYYHGVLELPEDYPFSPPKIRFFTQNGRFEVGKSICTTFTHYHKETWSSSWNIRTIITALISFMYANEKGIGGIFDSLTRRKNLAKKSLSNNIANPLFVSLFKEKLITRKLISQENF
jgi:ubiquitin-conjugating enzyme E2 J2